MTPAELMKSLREINTTAAEARRQYDRQAAAQVVHHYLLEIQATAQTAMRDVDSDARKLAAFDGLLDVCRRMEVSLANAVAIQEAVGVDLPLTNKLLTEARDVLAKAKPHTPDAPGKGAELSLKLAEVEATTAQEKPMADHSELLTEARGLADHLDQTGPGSNPIPHDGARMIRTLVAVIEASDLVAVAGKGENDGVHDRG